jgi:hypothetical protein
MGLIPKKELLGGALILLAALIALRSLLDAALPSTLILALQ